MPAWVARLGTAVLQGLFSRDKESGPLATVLMIVVVLLMLLIMLIFAPILLLTVPFASDADRTRVEMAVSSYVTSYANLPIPWDEVLAVAAVSVNLDISQVSNTVVESLAKKWVETYTWEEAVYDAKGKLIDTIEHTEYSLRSLSAVMQLLQLSDTDQTRVQMYVENLHYSAPLDDELALIDFPAHMQGTGSFAWPVTGQITSGYGWRWGKVHRAVDIAADTGTPIYAADSGVVVRAGWRGSYGQAVEIDHGNGFRTVYGHCSQLFVTRGAGVAKGQVIAAIGSTGFSTGPHLHFEVVHNGERVDPMTYFGSP